MDISTARWGWRAALSGRTGHAQKANLFARRDDLFTPESPEAKHGLPVGIGDMFLTLDHNDFGG